MQSLLHLLHWQMGSLPLSHLGSPWAEEALWQRQGDKLQSWIQSRNCLLKHIKDWCDGEELMDTGRSPGPPPLHLLKFGDQRPASPTLSLRLVFDLSPGKSRARHSWHWLQDWLQHSEAVLSAALPCNKAHQHTEEETGTEVVCPMVSGTLPYFFGPCQAMGLCFSLEGGLWAPRALCPWTWAVWGLRHQHLEAWHMPRGCGSPFLKASPGRNATVGLKYTWKP
ncbi:uncharacterized protein LOC102415182 isoform X3 [Bubalus bubalis]|uniref:uncharacterized protein LOC102415182 isoform X3 n=1 Tax=Bubalus bubalis TaxID=89462 RepID=UPI001E1B8841|nr:uncharacterized protein LOC102415182 isoform X3 [Bubalus bubalis]